MTNTNTHSLFKFPRMITLVLAFIIVIPIIAFLFDYYTVVWICNKLSINNIPEVTNTFLPTVIIFIFLLFGGIFFIDEYTFKNWKSRQDFLTIEKEKLKNIELSFLDNKINKEEASRQMSEIMKYFYPSMLRDSSVASWAEKYCPQYRARTSSIRADRS